MRESDEEDEQPQIRKRTIDEEDGADPFPQIRQRIIGGEENGANPFLSIQLETEKGIKGLRLEWSTGILVVFFFSKKKN